MFGIFGNYFGDDSDSEFEEEYSEPEDYVSKRRKSRKQYMSDPRKTKRDRRPDYDLRTKIWSALENLKMATAFACSDVVPSLPNPGLYLPKHGFLGLPLSTDDAKKIIAQASQSPFGKKDKTIIDITVRKCWELNPKQFLLKNREWKKALKTVVDSACLKLGIEKGKGTKVTAELNKLLLYEPGAFFKPHKDSEKAPGMFGTLVVCLPSPHKGGKLVMTFQDEKYEFETAKSSTCGYSYGAWFADITHEVQPVKSGYRLMLTYNLIRKADFEVPTYDLAHGPAQEISTLLEQYNSELQEGNEVNEVQGDKEESDDELPPMLSYNLKHKYTEANLHVNSLKPQDLRRVRILEKLATKLGFHIYLAILELSISTCDEGMLDEMKFLHLTNIIELDGTLVTKSFECPVGTLIDPEPQEARKADKEEHEGTTGNEGAPANYWYNDSVVVLIPPSKQMDFIFEFSRSRNFIEPMFSRLMKEFSEDPTQKLKLEELCAVALKHDPIKHWHSWADTFSKPVYSFFQQAAVTALDLGRIDLFKEACKKTNDKILLDNAQMLGGWVAKKGLDAMSDRLMQCVQMISLVCKKVEFLKLVAEGFKAARNEPGSSPQVTDLKQWLESAIFTGIADPTTLKRADGVSLVEVCETMNWDLFESKATPIILRAPTLFKISFINRFFSVMQQEFSDVQESYLKIIIQNIWDTFAFDSAQQKMEYRYIRDEDKENYLNQNDIKQIVMNTMTISSSKCLKTTIIPSMLSAIPKASSENSMSLLVSIVRMILRNRLVGFKLPPDQPVSSSSHKRLVIALLTRFLMKTVGPEPVPPLNWSLPAHGSCNCSNCSLVNEFLQDPIREKLLLPCAKDQCDHLSKIFYQDWDKCNYNTSSLTRGKRRGWEITKMRRKYDSAKSKWKTNFDEAVKTLSKLQNDEPVKGKLETYLQPFYDIIISVKIKKLPELKSLIPPQQIHETDENTAQNHPGNLAGRKREGSRTDVPGDGGAKRTK